MREYSRLLLRHWRISGLLLLIAVCYIIETFMVPVNQATLRHYHVDAIQLRTALVAIIVPYLIVWIVGLLGYIRLKEYVQSLGHSKDGSAFGRIATGMMWFTIWLPLSALLGSVSSAIYSAHPASTANVIRVENYINLLLLVPAFIYTYRGSKLLLRLIRGRIASSSEHVTMWFIGFAALYTFVVLEDSSRRVALNAASPATYYLPDWLIVLTIVVPLLVLWYMGLQAIRNIRTYRRKAQGVIYRAGLQRLGYGLAVTTLMLILLRTLQSMSAQLNKLSFGLVIILLYLLLIGLGTGYLLIARGARQLQQIEEA